MKVMSNQFRIMGIINLTPDSFYAGSRTAAHDFMPKMRQMFQDGADVIDIGACSTRPGLPLKRNGPALNRRSVPSQGRGRPQSPHSLCQSTLIGRK